jgi:hypothetical protein
MEGKMMTRAMPGQQSSAGLVHWARIRRRQIDGDETVPKGDCGRSLEVECGLVNPEECCVHATGLAPADDGAEDRAGLLNFVRKHRGARLDPRVVAADAAFRLRRW